MIRAIALLFIGLWVVTAVVAEESPISFRKDLVIIERSSEKIPIPEPASLKDSFADDAIIEPAAEGAIHANRNDHQYYLPSCQGYSEVNSQEVVPFPSEEIATEAGYQRAESCS
jgi:hypothetical protein